MYLLNFKNRRRLILVKAFQGRVDRLTKLKSGMENANNGIKDIVNVIGTGQEVKKDVTDVANQKLDAANGLIDQAEKIIMKRL